LGDNPAEISPEYVGGITTARLQAKLDKVMVKQLIIVRLGDSSVEILLNIVVNNRTLCISVDETLEEFLYSS
jgi:hypothetical protein